jgi:hypothetical protein
MEAAIKAPRVCRVVRFARATTSVEPLHPFRLTSDRNCLIATISRVDQRWPRLCSHTLIRRGRLQHAACIHVCTRLTSGGRACIHACTCASSRGSQGGQLVRNLVALLPSRSCACVPVSVRLCVCQSVSNSVLGYGPCDGPWRQPHASLVRPQCVCLRVPVCVPVSE